MVFTPPQNRVSREYTKIQNVFTSRLTSRATFFTSGHERKDIIWNWPTYGDWVHVEGLWVWDRSHPPEKTEIHPARFIAIRRSLPTKISIDNSVYQQKSVNDGSSLLNASLHTPQTNIFSNENMQINENIEHK